MDFTSWATLATAKNHFVAALTILVDLCNGDGKKKNRLGPPSRPSFRPSIKKIEEKESWQKTTCYSAANVKKNLWKLKNEKLWGRLIPSHEKVHPHREERRKKRKKNRTDRAKLQEVVTRPGRGWPLMNERQRIASPFSTLRRVDRRSMGSPSVTCWSFFFLFFCFTHFSSFP